MGLLLNSFLQFFDHVLGLLNIHVFRGHILAQIGIELVKLVDIPRGHLVHGSLAGLLLAGELGQLWLHANLLGHLIGGGVNPEVVVLLLSVLRSYVLFEGFAQISLVDEGIIIVVLIKVDVVMGSRS